MIRQYQPFSLLKFHLTAISFRRRFMAPKPCGAKKAPKPTLNKITKAKNGRVNLEKHAPQPEGSEVDMSPARNRDIFANSDDEGRPGDDDSEYSSGGDDEDDDDSDLSYDGSSIGWSSHWSGYTKENLQRIQAKCFDEESDDDDVGSPKRKKAQKPLTKKDDDNDNATISTKPTKTSEVDAIEITVGDVQKLRTHPALSERQFFVTKEQLDLVESTIATKTTNNQIIEGRRAVKKAVCAAVLMDVAAKRAQTVESNHAARRARICQEYSRVLERMMKEATPGPEKYFLKHQAITSVDPPRDASTPKIVGLSKNQQRIVDLEKELEALKKEQSPDAQEMEMLREQARFNEFKIEHLVSIATRTVHISELEKLYRERQNEKLTKKAQEAAAKFAVELAEANRIQSVLKTISDLQYEVGVLREKLRLAPLPVAVKRDTQPTVSSAPLPATEPVSSTTNLTREEIKKIRNGQERKRLLRALNIADRAEQHARARFCKNVVATDMPTIVANANEAIKSETAHLLKPHGAMTLSEYFGGLSFHTKIPKESLASLAGVSERTILNWKNDFLAERERKERAAPVVEALSKIIDKALENFRIRNPGRAPSTFEVWIQCRKIWLKDELSVFVLANGKKMPMPSCSSVRRCLIATGYNNARCKRDHQLSDSHLKTRLAFAQSWIERIEATFTADEKALAETYKASFISMRELERAYKVSGQSRSSDLYKNFIAAQKINEDLEKKLQPSIDKALKNISFSDEKYFTLATGNKRGWVKKGDPAPVFLDRGRFESKAMMWWAIAMDKYSPPVWYDGCTGTKETYSRTIAQSFCVGGRPLTSIFMQDNASAHNDLMSSAPMKEYKLDMLVIEWPPRSPDLNPIENLWYWLDRKKRAKQHKFHDIPHMKAWFQKFFESNDAMIIEKINNCVGSFYRRLVFVAQNNGALAPY